MPVDRVSLYRGLGSGIADATDTILSEIEKKKLLKKQQEDFLNFALQQIIIPGKQSTVGMLQNQNPVNPLNQVKLPGLPEDIQGAARRNILSKANLQEMPIAGMASRSSGFPLTTTMLPKTEKVFNPNNPELLRNTELLKNPYVMQALGLAKAQTELNKEKLYNIGEGTDVRDVNTGNLWARNQKEFAPVKQEDPYANITEIELRNELVTTKDPIRRGQIEQLLNTLKKDRIDVYKAQVEATTEKERNLTSFKETNKIDHIIKEIEDPVTKKPVAVSIQYKGGVPINLKTIGNIAQDEKKNNQMLGQIKQKIGSLKAALAAFNEMKKLYNPEYVGSLASQGFNPSKGNLGGKIKEFLGTGSQEEQDFRNNISTFFNILANVRSGTAFTENEKKLLTDEIVNTEMSPVKFEPAMENTERTLKTMLDNYTGGNDEVNNNKGRDFKNDGSFWK